MISTTWRSTFTDDEEFTTGPVVPTEEINMEQSEGDNGVQPDADPPENVSPQEERPPDEQLRESTMTSANITEKENDHDEEVFEETDGNHHRRPRRRYCDVDLAVT